MNVFDDARLVAALRCGGGDGFSVGADLGDGVEVGASAAREPVRDAAVADDARLVVDTGTALDEAVRTRRVGEQRARVVDALVIARVCLVVCSPSINQSIKYLSQTTSFTSN